MIHRTSNFPCPKSLWACFHVMLAHIGSKVSWRQIKDLNLASPRVYSVNQRLTC
jgi:hypothetical protein